MGRAQDCPLTRPGISRAGRGLPARCPDGHRVRWAGHRQLRPALRADARHGILVRDQRQKGVPGWRDIHSPHPRVRQHLSGCSGLQPRGGQRIQPSLGALLPDGSSVLATSTGIAVVAGTSTEYVDFPSVRYSCGNVPVAAPFVPSPAPSASTCEMSPAPIALAVDGVGNIWVATTVQDRVAFIPAGSY